MSLPSNASAPAEVEHHEEKNYLVNGTTIRSWLLTKDHKRIALMFIFSGILFFLVGGIYAMLVRFEHLTPGPTIMDAATYNRVFTLHGVIMIFLFLIPDRKSTRLNSSHVKISYAVF